MKENERKILELKAAAGEVPNINSEIIHVRHADLDAVGDSKYQRRCPACKTGSLPVTRNRSTFMLEAADRCSLCGQRVVYDDIEDLRQKDPIKE